jgi:AcrR family transcriptional regulator
LAKPNALQQEQLISGELIIDPNSAKGRLLHEAQKLFLQKGFEKTTVRDIAAAAGILSGSIFHHFANKEEILRSAMQDTICATYQRLYEELDKAESLEEAIKTLIRSELRSIHTRSSNAFMILGEWRSLNPDNQAIILQYREAYEKLWHQRLEQAIKAGMTQVEVIILRSFIRGALVDTVNWYQADGKYSLEDIADQVYSAFFISN